MMIEHGHLITSAHLERDAIVYVRQSGADQVRRHVESPRVQLSLREKAIEFGWRHPVVVDDDLGISAAGYAERPGFQSLLMRVAMRQVGIILCIDASRLSRNCKDWAHLFELCQHFGTLIADVEQIYDLSKPNDRLIMGIKGTVSEMELGVIRHRLRSGVDAKAARGELRVHVPTGYAYDADDKIVFDPDRRIRVAIETMFRQFDHGTSVRQLAMWYRDTETSFPTRLGGNTAPVRWGVPTSNTLRKLLLHPIYAGVYVYGRRQTVVEFVDGQLIKRETDPRPVEQAQVCIRDHHPAYIGWEQFLANRAKIQENRPRWDMQQNRGAIREGLALLVGMLRCGRCGTTIRVGYKRASALYYCDGGKEKGSKRCNAFGSKLIDERVSEELCRALEPHAVQVAIRAAEDKEARRSSQVENAQLQVEAAQYQVDRALEQFDLCDPKNRHVADILEERLNDKLAALRAAKGRWQQIVAADDALTRETRTRLDTLARDFPAVWNHANADPKLKKRVLRAAIREILVASVDDENQLEVTIHWHGGVHTRVHVKRPVRSPGMPPASLQKLVRQLAELPDADVARILNMKKITTPGGLRWTHDRVRDYRKQRASGARSETSAVTR